MMAGESRMMGNSGTSESTPPPIFPDASASKDSIRSLLGQRERGQEMAHGELQCTTMSTCQG